MERLVMRRCCCKCGWSVHKCAIVNIIVSMILSVMLFVSSICDLKELRNSQNYESFRNTLLHVVLQYDSHDLFAEHGVIVLSVQLTIIMLVNSIVGFALCVAALYGILMRKKYYVLPWLIFNGMSLVGLTFLVVIFCVVFPVALVLLFLVVPYAYIYIVGHSFFFRLAAAEARARDGESFIN
nr:uncharacterized protein LOC111424407 isoform X2 [Onthophagus taurus]